MITRADVAIIGGGPSGLHTARLLADRGLDVIVFDGNAEIGKNAVCSGVVSAEAFSRYDLPWQSVLAAIEEAEFVSPGGRVVSYRHSERAAFVVDRHLFDKSLGDAAVKSGARVSLGTMVHGIEIDREHVVVHTVGNGVRGMAIAKLAVIATGVNFKLQAELSLGTPKKVLKGIQLDTIVEGGGPTLRVFFGNRFSKGFFGWGIRLRNGKTRIGVMTEGNPISGFRNVLRSIANGNSNGLLMCRPKRRGISFGAAKRSFDERLIVVGEAAGQVKTTTGGGIYWGLIGGEIAAETIIKAFSKGDFSRKTLAEYERRWKGVFGKEIAYGEFFHRLYSRLDDDSIESLFDAALKDGLPSFIAEKGRFDWHKNAIVRILRSPNLRRVLMGSLIKGAVGIP